MYYKCTYRFIRLSCVFQFCVEAVLEVFKKNSVQNNEKLYVKKSNYTGIRSNVEQIG